MRMTIHSVRSPAPDNFGMTEWTGDLNVRNASLPRVASSRRPITDRKKKKTIVTSLLTHWHTRLKLNCRGQTVFNINVSSKILNSEVNLYIKECWNDVPFSFLESECADTSRIDLDLESGNRRKVHVHIITIEFMFAGINMFWARLRLIWVWEGPKTYLCPRT